MSDSITPYYQREGVTLYNADCRDVLPTLGRVDCVITDPPYGIRANGEKCGGRGIHGWRKYTNTDWDENKPAKIVFDLILAMGCPAIIWGGQYFTDSLPPNGKWLVWDKGQTDFSLADCEFAWCSFGNAARRITYSRAKALQDGKVHPTQKPVAVMKWCIGQIPKHPDLILDPFTGSGTTAVACIEMKRRFIGVELSREYCDVAVGRIETAFEKAKQMELAL